MFRQMCGYTRPERLCSRRTAGVVSFGVVVVLLGLVTGAAGTVGAQSAPDCSTVTYPGDGTEPNPYEVGDVDELQCIDDQGLNENYVQVSEIDASGTSSWNGGDGFEPIGGTLGPTATNFSGTYNGQGFNITGLTIDRDEPNVGLFFGIEDDGEVEDTSVVNADITGLSFAGGIASFNSGNISESYVSGSVGNPDSGVIAGGIVAVNGVEGTIEESYSTASINGSGIVGGFTADNSGTIEESYTTGSVDGMTVTGGFAGTNTGTITESYAAGSVTDEGINPPPLVSEDGGTADESHGAEQGRLDSIPDTVGGLIGFNDGGTVTDSYWDIDATGQSDSDGGTGLTTSEMTGSAATNNMQGFDFANTWETVLGDYPVLAWQTEDDNAAPTASFTFSPSSPSVSDTVTFDASGSTDPDGTIQTYGWDFGDGTTGTGETATQSFSAPGDYTVTLTVTDDNGATSTTAQTVSVSGGGGAGATVESGDVGVDGTGETGESAIEIDADNGVSIARLNVSVDTSVAEITSVDPGADVDPSQPATNFNVIDQTADSVRIEYSNLQAQASPIQNFELARIEFEAQTDEGDTPIQLLVDQLRDGNTDPYGTISESEGTFSVGVALFPDPLPGFNSPPMNTGQLDPNLYEDVNGDGDGLDPSQTVTLWTQLVVNPDDFDDLTQEQVDALDWDGDGQLTPSDAVELWTEQVLN